MIPLEISNDHLIDCIQLRINEYIRYINIIERDKIKQKKYIKNLIKNIKKFPLTNDGLLAALMYCEREVSKFEYVLECYFKKHFKTV